MRSGCDYRKSLGDSRKETCPLCGRTIQAHSTTLHLVFLSHYRACQRKGMVKYFRYQERNSWEGETWNFYIPEKDNEEALKLLKIKLPYRISAEFLSEKMVNVLVNQSGTGYMRFHNKMKGKIDVKLIHSLDGQKLEDLLYKGNLERIGLFKVPGGE